MSSETTRQIKLLIEYDGADFVGWQKQPTGPSIQSEIETVLERVTGEKIRVFGSGRTDSGVHAMGQVAHFAGPLRISAKKWRSILNDHLPFAIRVLASEEVDPSFHALNDSKGKIYVYRVLNREFSSALDRRVFFFPRPLDWDRIEATIPYFLGTHDFKAFQAAKASAKTSVRTLTRFVLHRDERLGLYSFEIEGTGFLKQMVRNIVGTLLEVGERRRSPEDIPVIFESRDRRKAGRTAPASGLCLVKVLY